MSRRRKPSQVQGAASSARAYVFVISDQYTRNRVTVAGPILFQLVRRGWASQLAPISRQENGQTVEEIGARLISHFALRSAILSPEGNLSLAALAKMPEHSIRSWWPSFEEKIMQSKFGCALSFRHAQALDKQRQDAIREECLQWGLPEVEPIVTGRYLQPEEAHEAIVK